MSEPNPIKKRPKWLYWLGGLAALGLLIIIAWMTVETGIEVTSRADFCGTCHSMQPMVNSYHADIHGGNNPRGIMASCTDCHVSHQNVFAHFVGKAQSGTHDVIVTVFTDEMNNDWQALRLERERYVYDSGCLTCHRNLINVAGGSRQHENYFAGLIDTQCVTCHEEVGHSNLNKYLLSTKYESGN